MFDTSAAGHDFNIDNGTFVVDASANRVGIGKTNPSTLLDVNGTATATTFVGALTGNVTGTILTAAQTNITSVGTLTGLTLSGALVGTKASFDTASTTDYALRLTDNGVADYDVIFPDTSTYQLTTNTTSNKTFKLLNSGSGVFNLNVSGALTVDTTAGESAFVSTSYPAGFVRFGQNVGGGNPTDTAGLHIGWNRSNGGREVNMIFNSGAANADGEMIFTAYDGTTYANIFTINGGGNVDITSGGLRIGTTTVIDSSRNLTNLGTISSSGQVTITQTNPTLFLQESGGGTTDAAYLQKYNNDLYLYNKEANGSLFLGTNNDTKVTITTSGNVGIGGSPDSDSGLHLKGDGKRILIDSTDYNLVSLGRRGSSGAGLDKAYLRMRNASTNTVVIDTDGSSYFNGGNVGIGDSTPQALLDVGGGYGGNTTVATFAHATDAYIEIENMTTQNGAGIILTNAGTKKWTIQKDTSAHGLYIQDASANANMTFLQGGNVGIGTSSPATPLHIQTNDGTTNTTVNSLMITNSSTGTTTTGFGGEIRFQAERNNGVLQNTGGIRSLAEVNSGSNISSGMSFDTSVAGVNHGRVRISYDGKVGIGTDNPGAYYMDKLVVVAPDESGMTLAGTGTNQRQMIAFADSTSGDARYAGYIAYDHNNDTMSFNGGGAGAARLTILSNGNIVKGNASSTQFVDYVHRKAYSINRVYTHIANINSTNLGCSYEVHIKGTASSVVVNSHFHIMCNHYQDIAIKSFGGAYTACKVKVVTNGNEDSSLYIGAATVNNTTFTGTVSIRVHDNATVDMAPSSAYSTNYLEHAQDGISSQESTNGSAASGSGPTNAYTV